ncbi:MAG TPA: hypothetical protein VKS20_11045 [Candidatus Acidoferrales bacterium]|nr:hypothetical protein [Candidatus Acidoferrales bacterium]
MKALNANPKFRAKAREGFKKMLADPERNAAFRAACRAGQADPEVRQKKRCQMKALNANPEFMAKMSAGIERFRSDPKAKEKAVQRLREALSRPDVRERRAAAAAAFEARPEVKELRRKKMKAMWASIYRKMHRGGGRGRDLDDAAIRYADGLNAAGVAWPEIARRIKIARPDIALPTDRRAAGRKVERAVGYVKKKNGRKRA